MEKNDGDEYSAGWKWCIALPPSSMFSVLNSNCSQLQEDLSFTSSPVSNLNLYICIIMCYHRYRTVPIPRE